MKKLKAILALTLALSMMLTFVACVTQPETPVNPPSTTGSKQPGTAPATEPPATEDPHANPGVPLKDYGDATYRIMAKDVYSTIYGRARDVEFDDSLSEVNTINEAVRDRNNYIQDKYHVLIKGVFVDEETKQLENALGANLSVCEVIEAASNSYVSLIENNYLADLNTYSPYLDLSQTWWNQKCRSSMSIANKLFFEAGDIMTTDKEATWAVAFNRDLVNNNNLANPYNLVDSYDWTYDNMYSLGQQISNAADHPGDQFAATWGIVSEDSNNYMMWQGCGSRLIVKDSTTDLPYLGPLNEGAYDAMLKVATMQYDKNVTLLASAVKGVASAYFDGTIKIFQTGHSLFFIGSMSIVEWMRDNDMDFGVLPMPKLDKTQTEYYSSIGSAYAYTFAIPDDKNADREFVAIISQALGCESTDTLIQAYYDKTLVHKGLRRPEDVRMLNLVYDSRVFDLSQVFDWASPLSSKIGSAKSETKIKNIKSSYDSYKGNIDGAIATFLQKQKLA